MKHVRWTEEALAAVEDLVGMGMPDSGVAMAIQYFYPDVQPPPRTFQITYQRRKNGWSSRYADRTLNFERAA